MPEVVEVPVLARSVLVTLGILGVATNVSLQNDDDCDEDIEDMDQRGWIMAETENRGSD